LDVSSILEIIAHFNNNNFHKIAMVAVSYFTDKAAQIGDVVSAEILSEAANDLVEMVQAVAKLLGHIQTDIKLIISGDCIKKNASLLALFIKRMLVCWRYLLKGCII